MGMFPLLLRLIKRCVGLSEDAVIIRGLFVDEHRANAAGDVRLSAIGQEPRHPFVDPAALAFHALIRSHAFGQHDEFIAPKAADDVCGAERLLEHVSHAAQHGIPHQMSRCVVDLFEIVQIEDKKGASRFRGAGVEIPDDAVLAGTLQARLLRMSEKASRVLSSLYFMRAS